MLVLQADAERAWSVDAMVRETRSSHAIVSAAFERFERSGLARRTPAELLQFAPAGEAMAQLCDHVRATYRERPVAIINLIATPSDRLQQLADAFRFRP